MLHAEPTSSRMFNSKRYAYKVMNPEYETQFMIDFEVLSQLKHECIVKLAPDEFQDQHKPRLYFAMELLQEDLGFFLSNRRQAMDAKFVWRVLYDTARGLQYMHAHGYVHCDVRLANLLLTKDCQVKIADFGTARPPGDKLKNLINNWWLKLGNGEYAAPELDMFCLGLAALELTTCVSSTHIKSELGGFDVIYNPGKLGSLLAPVDDALLADTIRQLMEASPEKRMKPDALISLAGQQLGL